MWRGTVRDSHELRHEPHGEAIGILRAGEMERCCPSVAPPGLDYFPLAPTAHAVGCILTPLRGCKKGTQRLKPLLKMPGLPQR